MATEAAQQVQDDAVDTVGVSNTTSTYSTLKPRNGPIYTPVNFAAAPPVWFHRLQDGRYLALFKNRWHAATAAYHVGPQLFSTWTEDTVPVWAIISPTTGTFEGPYPWIGLDVLTTALSKGDYLYTLGTLNGVATVQHWTITRTGGLQLQGAEPVPLNYSLGLWADTNYLRVFGADEDGHLASVRKNWGRIGANPTTPTRMFYADGMFPTDTANLTSQTGIPRDNLTAWEYEGTKGWYGVDYLDQHSPTPPGILPASGPVSIAKKGNRLYLMTTEHVAGAYAGRVYTARTVDQDWQNLTSDVIPLGDDSHYLGGTAYLQPQLPTIGQGIAYVKSTRIATGGDGGILTEWGTLVV